ncbi:MAG: hypothetical protein C0429_11720 [Sphingopyxis sp.]|nr:hypothetical protein [Sphingopyxis sp.]
MKRSIALIGLFGALTSGQALYPEAAPKILELSGDFTVPLIIEGKQMRLRVDPDIGSSRALNAEAAQTLGLKLGMIRGVHMVGPVKLTAGSRTINIDYGVQQAKDRVFWFLDRAASSVGDGIIAPTALPYDVVIFNLRSPRANERQFSLPLSSSGGNAWLMVGTERVALGFNLMREETLATASTGNLIAATNKGAFAEKQKLEMIRFGVERPVRAIALGVPLDVGGRTLNEILVRVADFGDASAIPENLAADEDEIVVTAKSKKKPDYSMALGRAFLSQCSSLTYDFKAKLVRFSCAPN